MFICLKRLSSVCFYFSILSCVYGEAIYFVCGTDEDGCSAGYYQFCICMPYDGAKSELPYCLDFNDVSCKPLTQSPNCPTSNIFKNQVMCLAVAFQSEPYPPCSLTTETFCKTHRMLLCDKDGGQHTCRA